MAPQLPPAMEWELSLWILGNHSAIADAAVQAIILNKGPTTEESDWVLSIYFVARWVPRRTDKQPDPRPGAAEAAHAAIAAGKRTVLVYCWCDPMAFELCIVPPESLPQRRPNLDWFKALCKAVNPRGVVIEDRFFHTPPDMRPDDPTISSESDFVALVRKWAQFYEAPMKGACAKALNLRRRPDTCEQFVWAIHIRRRRDRMSNKSLAFTFRVVTCEKVRNTELAKWVHKQRIPLGDETDNTLHAMIEKQKNDARSPNHFAVQTFVCAESPALIYGGVASEHCQLAVTSWVPRSADLSTWVAKDPAPYLREVVEKGRYLTDLHMKTCSFFESNAWGFEATRREHFWPPNHHDEVVGEMPLVNQPDI